MNGKWKLAVVGMLMFCVHSCAPLPPEPTDTSTPERLAKVLVKSLIKGKEQLFADDILLTQEALATIAENLEKDGSVSLNPKYLEEYEKARSQVVAQWVKVRQQAQTDGVLWDTAKYYGCRYKIRQHKSLMPTSMSFEIYFESGGYFYLIKISSISNGEEYFVFDSISWEGETKKPENISGSKE